jgi:hypothetical protein
MTVCERCSGEVEEEEVMMCEKCEQDGLCPDCYNDHGCEV